MNDNGQLAPMPAQTGNQLTAVTTTGMPDWFSPGGSAGFFTPMPIATDAEFSLVNRMALTKDVLLLEMLGEEIGVRGWLASPWQGVNEETGKEENGVRIGLLLDDGRIAVTYSFGVRKSIQLATARYGCKEWDPPVKFLVSDTKAKLGRMLVLLPAGEVQAARPAGKGKR